MEAMAENHFTLNRRLFFEGVLRVSRSGYGKAAWKAMAVVALLWGIFFGYTLATGGDAVHALGFLLILGFAGLWLCVGIPRRNARRSWNALTGKYGKDPLRITVFYENHLEVRGEGLEKRVAYSDISQILTSRHLLVLVCADKTAILVARKGFTTGNDSLVPVLVRGTDHKEEQHD